MSKLSPIFYITLEDESIEGFVESVTIKDSIDKEGEVTLNIKEDYILKFADNANVVPDNIIQIKYGYLGNIFSRLLRYVISDIELKYSSEISMTLKGMDIGMDMKRNARNKIWKGTTYEIVNEIADQYNLKKDIDNTGFTYLNGNVPQGNLSDLDFVRSLAKKEPKYVRCWIVGDTLYYKKEKYSEKSSVIVYNVGNGSNVKIFKPIWSKVAPSAQAGSVKSITDNENNTTSNQKTKTVSEGIEIYDVNGKYKGLKDATDNNNSSSIITNKPNPDTEATKNELNSIKNEEVKKALTATLVIEGNPLLEIDDIITIRGTVAQRHKGNWIIKGITHNISLQGFITTLELNRDSQKRLPNDRLEQSEKSNTSVGANEKNNTKKIEVLKFDFDGNAVQ